MKRVGNIYEIMKSKGTAVMAILEGTRNKHHLKEVRKRFLSEDLHSVDHEKIEKEAEKLAEKLDGWEPAALTVKYFHMPGHKDRQLAVPTLTDHLFGWMLIIALKPVLMRGMYQYCIGSVPGRGIEYGRAAVERWVQHDREAEYFVKLDIRQYYRNVDTELLKEKFRKIVKDPQMLHYIDLHIDMTENAVNIRGEPIQKIQGLPIGTYTAPWFANFYLQDLDHFIMEQLYKTRRGKRQNYVRHYLRNIDDMLLIGSSRRDLEKAVRSVIEYLGRIGLRVHEEWEIKRIGEMTETEGEYRLKAGTYPVDILGYRFYRSETTVRSSIYLNTLRTARKIRKDLEHGKIMLHDAESLVSRIGWFSHADSKEFMRQIREIVPLKFVKGVIGYATKNGIIGISAVIYCDKRGADGCYHILYGCGGGAERRNNGVYGYSVGFESPVAGASEREDRFKSGKLVSDRPGCCVQLSLF